MIETLTPPAVRGVLLLTARSALTDQQQAQLRAHLAERPDWTALIAAALHHGTAGLLCHHLCATVAAALPPDIGVAARSYLSHAEALHTAGLIQLHGVLAALSQAGIRCVPFKGPALAEAAYALPFLRGFRDLDILIDATDLDAAMRVFDGLGYHSQHPTLRLAHRRAYQRYNGQDMLSAEGMLPVEPHWQFGPRTLAADLDIAALLHRCPMREFRGQTVSILSVEDALLAACLHGGKEEWRRLRDIVDVAELLRAYPVIAWPALRERADAAGVHRMLLLGLALAKAVLDAPLPPDIRAAIAVDRAVAPLVALVRRRLEGEACEAPSVFAFSWMRLAMRERLRDQLHYAISTLTTARVQHFRAVDLPDWLGFLYPVVKLLHDYAALPLWLAGRSLVCKAQQGRTP